MPVTGRYWQSDQRYYPRTQYWDTIGKQTEIPTIHFIDYPELSQFDCPDWSHLDATDVPEFTRSLARTIKQEIHDIE